MNIMTLSEVFTIRSMTRLCQSSIGVSKIPGAILPSPLYLPIPIQILRGLSLFSRPSLERSLTWFFLNESMDRKICLNA